jgi:Mg2+ and Co2+ transporter CorA
MNKKSKLLKVNLPFIEYNWYKEITENEIPNIKIIEDQIDSFLFAIHHQNDIKMSYLKEELMIITKIMIGKSVIIQISKDYQEKFLEINRFIKKYFDSSPRVITW